MNLDFLGDLRRTHTCGELRPVHAGREVLLMGWVDRARDLGTLIFVELRDREGVTQVVFNRDQNPAAHARAGQLGREYVVAVKGRVVERSATTVNPRVLTGSVEVMAEELLVLNDARTPPFNLDDDSALTDEETRLRYRFLDLRRPRMQANIALRHRLTFETRRFLTEQGFFEIETPFLTRSTPEGARDYLVPSRIYPGQFYALPQSPQIFKQILMVSGFDRYFQVVRCFRDEDPRADRQPEFTQIDLEISFAQPERVFEVVEPLLLRLAEVAGGQASGPFPRITYDQALRQYGTDKPDLRLPPLVEVNEHVPAEAAERLRLPPGIPVLAFRLPKCADLSRKEREELQAFATERGARALVELRWAADGLEGSLAKGFPQMVEKVARAVDAQPGDLIPLVAGKHATAGELRLYAGQKHSVRHGLLDPRDLRFLIVTDFPMFEWHEGEQRWFAMHHPFTSPHERDMDKLESDPGVVRALAYDVVLNGYELGSGSIRIHRRDVQARIFAALGMSPEEARARFGFFLDALEYGTPPHGGIALGFDRTVMLLAGETAIREVIPFPKTARAVDLMMEAPTPVGESQLAELGLQIKPAGRGKL